MKHTLIRSSEDAPFRNFVLPRKGKVLPRVLIISTLGESASDAEGINLQSVSVAFEGIATVQFINVFSIRGYEVAESHWLQLTRQIQAILETASVNGIVVIHGADSIEETGFFLSQTVSTMVPVVLTTASDLGKLRAAIRVAASPEAFAYGVVICADGSIHSPKTIVRSGRAFESLDTGTLGTVDRMGARFHNTSMNPFQQPLDVSNATQLPRVEIVPAHAGATDGYIRHCIDKGVKGLVLAGVGNGTANKELINALSSAVRAGVLVIRSTRITSAIYVSRNYQVDDDHYGFVASGTLDAPRSRILAQLLLENSVKDPLKVQAEFDQRSRQ